MEGAKMNRSALQSRSAATPCSTFRGASGRRVFLAAALLGVNAPFAALAQAVLPPLVQPPSTEHHVGKVILLELITPDLGSSRSFYSQLFGWSFRDVPLRSVTYAEASLDSVPVAGFLQKERPAGGRPPAWLAFFAVPDVDAAVRSATERGATLLFGPRTFADRGREAVLSDAQGAVFGLLSSSSGDPPDYLATPGEWIWSSLITTDPDSAAAFYQAVFGYEVHQLAASEGAQHLLFASRNYARASVNSLPRTSSDARPHWINYVRVVDAEQSAAKAQALGGRLLVPPRPDRQGGKLAVVADTIGAAFGLLEWPEAFNKQVQP